jgi:glyoxylase-like metal-dependent hydrolase (beta-lactamase superfamily II)
MATSTTQIGDIRLTVVEEFVLPTSVRWMFPDSEAPFDILERALPWLQPHFANERGHLLQAMQTFVIEAGGVTIAVDTGVGNDKQRGGGIPDFNMRSGPFLEELTAAGFPPERFDFVIATHMHTDHVGWNTRLEDGAWVPTFPNARYLFVDREWAHWSAEAERSDGTRALVEDSLQPVVDAGRVDIVTPDHRVTEGVWLEPSFGHSPGHVNVRIASADREAAIIGDMMHNPIQAAAFDERPTFDRDPVPARETRRAFLERTAGSDVLVFGSHWHLPAGGRVRRDGDAFRIEAIES